MKLHRFYVNPNTALKHNFWLHDEKILHQWKRVLRFQAGQQVVLFDGLEKERLYRLESLSDKEAHLALITDMVRQVPNKNIYLLWSLLKKDKNDWVLQKCTELGVSHFVPLLADRSEKTGFDVERANKIIIEASEQCGRGDIPNVREPMNVITAIHEFKGKIPLLVCEQGDNETQANLDEAGLLIGPEGGWTDAEKQLFAEEHLTQLVLHDFTLRAETASIVATSKLLQ